MAKIRVLDETTANQIAAGEVVDRPHSVVKELMENALDAGATRIAVVIEHGGKTRLRVEDDGHGIAREEVALAFERHATSKLESARDLERITTMGFRGEALPSIASVSRLSLTTLARGEREGTRIEIHGGKRVSLEPASAAPGTVIEVRDLFFNVPARLKFLKATGAETAAASATFLRQALAHPAIHYSFSSAGREEWNLTRASSLRERAEQLFGGERARNWLEAERSSAGARLVMLLEPPGRHHPTRGEQYLFVNRRAIADRGLAHALLRGYEGLLPARRFPAAVLFLELDPGQVDVNVHPAKSEVRFADATGVQALVAHGIRDALARSGFAPRARALPVAVEGEKGSGLAAITPPGAPARERSDRVREAVEDARARSTGDGAAAGPGRRYTIRAERGTLPAGGVRPLATEPPQARLWAPARGFGSAAAEAAVAPAGTPEGGLPRVLGQYRQTFVVAADAEGLLLVDQHTAHERVLYEALEAGAGAVAPAQRLLLPELVELGPDEASILRGCLEELGAAGVEVDALDGPAFAVRSLPPGVLPTAAGALLRASLESLAEGGGAAGPERVRDRIRATVACHAAVKRNMPLDLAEMQRLVADLLRCRDPYRCPHGRAILLRFDDQAIQRSFGRYW